MADTNQRVEAGLVEKDFEYQPREENVEDGVDLETMDEALGEEKRAGAQNPTGVRLPSPSEKQNPYMSQEEQGMEMTPKTFGPPQYGSPNPATASSRLLTLEDGHPLDTIPEDNDAAISSDYAQDVIGVADPTPGTHHGGPGRADISDLDRHTAGDFSKEANDEVDATDSARELANENSVNLADVEGTGKDGRVIQDDVEKYLAERDTEDNNES